MYCDAYDLSKEYATYNGKFKAATWQGCPGVFVYRRDIAKKVFGVSSPNDVQALVKDWNSFFKAAVKLKKAGYYIVSNYSDISNAVLGAQKNPWVTAASDSSDKLTLDSSVTQYLKYAKKISDGGYSKGASMWSEEWFESMDTDIFGYFGTTWFMGMLEENCGKTFGKWGTCTGPSPYQWGGTTR